ncbi:MAG: ABC transporter ATP-binding protein [Bacteroidales bacterium]
MGKFWKIIREYVYPYKGYVALNILFNFLGVIFSLASLIMIGPFLRVLFGLHEAVADPVTWEFSKQAIETNFNYFIRQMIDNQGPQSALIFISVAAIILFFLKTANIYLANYVMAPIRNGVVRDIRNRIYGKIIDLPIGYFSREKKGDIMARVTQDVQEVEWSIMASLEKFFRDPLNMIIFLIGMFLMSPGLTLFVLLLLPVSAFVIGSLGRNLRKTSVRGQNQMGTVMSILEETLSGLRVIKAFNAEEDSRRKFGRENDLFARIMNAITRRRDLASPLSEFLGSVVVVGLIAYGGNLVLMGKGGLSAPSFIAYIAIFSQILSPAKSFSSAYYHLNKGLASIDRINQVLSAPVAIKDPDRPVPVSAFNESIRFENLSFTYENTPVVKNVSFEVRKGETVAIVGQSGSGKSTLVDLLARFHEPQSGRITIDGTDIRSFKSADLRALMGIVPQDPVLFNDTIAANMAIGTGEPDPERLDLAARASHSWEFIRNQPDGFNSFLGDRGNTLSGGERQRICLARAIYRNPPILILDEATSSLDAESERLVQLALQDLMAGRTSIVIAHRLSTIMRANRIIVIKEGEIIETGTHEELMRAQGEYRYLFDTQNFNNSDKR